MARLELASLTLFPATPAQVLESRRLTWPEWGGILTEEQYLERESRLDTMEHATNSRMITWVLAPRHDPSTLDFMCSCETYERQGLARYSGSDVQETTCYAVASVFTPPRKRRKGYASHMMRLLHWIISKNISVHTFPVEWGPPPPEVAGTGNGLFSVLYSDIGTKFYKQAGPGIEKTGGWETRSPISTIWNIPPKAETRRIDEDQWRWLDYSDLDTFWKKDVQGIRCIMRNTAESSPDYHIEKPTAFVSCLPDKGVGLFQVFRSIFGAESIVAMDKWGVEKTVAGIDQPTYATWSIDVRPLPPTLIVTRIRATESTFPGLLCCIQEAARKSGIGKMEIWNLPRDLHSYAKETGGQTFERKVHLPAIKWYGTGETSDIEWVLNEKFGWC